VIALIVTSDGYPVGYKVFDGNTHDSTTVQEIVQKVEAEHGKARGIWVMDRGNVSEANLSFLRERGCKYIVGTPKAMLRLVRDEITTEGWKQVREGIEVKEIKVRCEKGEASETYETYILCRSQDRISKESAMLDRFVARMEKGLEAMKKSAENGRLRDPEVANRRVGRLMERYWRASACFQVRVIQLDTPVGKSRLKMQWTKDESAKLALCGCYLLRTNVQETDPVKLWQQYIQLTDVEWAFRITKDELELRPIFHRNPAGCWAIFWSASSPTRCGRRCRAG
jgi:transposase